MYIINIDIERLYFVLHTNTHSTQQKKNCTYKILYK